MKTAETNLLESLLAWKKPHPTNRIARLTLPGPRLGLALGLAWALAASAAPPVITSPSAAVGSNGLAFSYQITATESPTGYDASGLPAGLSVDGTSGWISGRPAQVGASLVTLYATNLDGVGTGTLTLTLVLAAPGIATQPAPLSVKSGEVATFKVGATGQVALAYQWFKNGAPLTRTDRISGVDAAQLNVSPALPPDAGNYTVIVSQGDSNVLSQVAPLFMDQLLPVIATHPLSQSLSAGATATFHAGATGSPALAYRWQRDGVDLADDAHLSGAATPSLSIANVAATDTGWYSLTVSNADGRVSSQPARLSIPTAGDLADAMNFDEGTWTTGGNSAWLAQSGVTHDGTNAARSGSISQNSSTFLETTVYGPGDLAFYWKVSSEAGYDSLVFLVDGVARDSISGGGDWTPRTFHLSWGPHLVRWHYQKDHSIDVGTDAGWVDEFSFTPTRIVSLETAVAPIPLPLRTYGEAPWFGQVNVNHDGASAARSGYLTHYQSSTLETTVSGPGTVAFAWKISSEWTDPVVFLVDGVGWESIAGEVDWTNRTFHLPWGQHTLSWRYQKDHSINIGADAAWLDQVTYTPVTLFDLTTASDAPSLPWTTGGSLPWFGQNEFTPDGTHALQSGPITHNQSSVLDSAVTGPGTLTFDWKVSSEAYDPLVFSIDGIGQNSLAREADWNPQTYVIRPGAHALRWAYVKDRSVTVGTDAAWLDRVAFAPAPSLPVALDSPELVWSTFGDAAWFPEMVTTHDGVASARSGDIGHNQSTILQTTVTGPGTLSFFWKSSSEGCCDILVFSVDGEPRPLQGGADWNPQTYALPAGTHTLQWRYQKDRSVTVGADAAWLDRVRYQADAPAHPTLLTPVVGVTPGGKSFGLSVATENGRTYALQYKNQLSDPEWITLPAVPGDGTVKALSDPSTLSNAPRRFYRVLVQ